ncbi:MAG: pseudouridine-5'-phosphate glycosidase [Anaerolineae bacterium]|nr:pseudouridine-5'-phosphate glycosidase [Anaerolineae bacterium]
MTRGIMANEFVDIQSEVADVLSTGGPVVALESTVITHGLPYPANVETALAMEQAVRDGGATPATVAIMDGRIKVGLSAETIDQLAQLPSDNVRKCSRRDLPIVIARGENGATTVAGTMIIADRVGIELFATGGIGGVHRGHPFDVSADLAELGRTPVTVVCSGAKSILDLAATRELLETNGVAVVGYGTDEMPAFFTCSSGLPVDVRVDSAEDVAALIRARRKFGLETATLVTVPVPNGEGMDSAEMEAAIAQATRESDAQGIHGAAATPWLLSRLVELTDGRTLQANTALLRNNGFVAGQIASALSELTRTRRNIGF